MRILSAGMRILSAGMTAGRSRHLGIALVSPWYWGSFQECLLSCACTMTCTLPPFCRHAMLTNFVEDSASAGQLGGSCAVLSGMSAASRPRRQRARPACCSNS
eukprot:360874-Chlamydomonas_euryale.AAC.31